MDNQDNALTLDDLIFDPKSYGLPTFEEFCKNPDKWRMASEQAFAQLEQGSVMMKNQIEKHIYYVSGYKCSSLEQAQRILSDEYGIVDSRELNKLGVKIELQDTAMGKAIAHIYLDPKREPLSAAKITDVKS